MASTPGFRRGLASTVIGLVGVYVLLGALAKLFVGTPADLPPAVMRLMSDVDLTFRLVISAELIVAAAALVAPRLGWVLLAAQLLVFLVVLGGQIAAGQTSCGCFGGNIHVRPEVMFGIDLVALVAVLAVKPWAHARPLGKGPLLLVPLLLLAIAAPWIVLPPQDAGGDGSHPATGSAPSRPAVPPRWLTLTPANWVGKRLSETELAKYIPTEKFEGWDNTSTLVFYRLSCEHCAKHLEQLAKKKDGGVYVLVVVPDEVPKETVVKIKPDVPVEVALPLPPGGAPWLVHVPTEVVLDKDGRVEKVTPIIE